MNLGLVISFSHDPSQAFPYLNRFHELRPLDAAGDLALGSAYYRARDYETADGWLKNALRDGRTAAEAHFYLGRVQE